MDDSHISFAVRVIFALYDQLDTFRLVAQGDDRGASLPRVFARGL
jgi:hypothetical protein